MDTTETARALSTARASHAAPAAAAPEAAMPGVERSASAAIAPSARFDIGDRGRVILADGCQIRDGAHFEVHDEGVVRIGERVVVGVNNWIQGNGDVTIEDGTILGPNVVITSTHHQMDLAYALQDQPLSKRAVHVGRDVWIGANATIVAGVRIGDQAVIGANSLVNRDVPAAAIVGGVPAKTIGRRTEQPVRRRILFAIALGITDRPERWTEIARFFVTMGNTLREAGVQSWYACHPKARGPLSRAPKERRWISETHEGFDDLLERVRPDVVFIWNGGSNGDAVTSEKCRKYGIECRFGELGWFPQSQTVYFDAEGTNARSSIRRLDLSRVAVHPGFEAWLADWRAGQNPADPGERGYVFVPLQDERDLNITLASPYRTMDAFVSALSARFPQDRFIVRPHPQFTDVSLTRHENVEVRTDGALHGWLRHADAVAGINSTALLEAVAWGKPVHAVGEGVATGLDVLHDWADAEQMRLHREMPAERRERARRLLSELVFVRQTRRKDLHYLDRLRRAHGIADLIAGTPLRCASAP